MNDTVEPIARMQREYYAAMSPEERMRIAASMYETARATVASSLPRDTTPAQVRYAIARLAGMALKCALMCRLDATGTRRGTHECAARGTETVGRALTAMLSAPPRSSASRRRLAVGQHAPGFPAAIGLTLQDVRVPVPRFGNDLPAGLVA